MTDPSTTPIPVVGAPSGAPATAVADGEVLASAPQGLELLGEVPGSGYRQAPALARRADGQVITLTPLLQQTMAAIDGRRDLAEVAAAVSADVGPAGAARRRPAARRRHAAAARAAPAVPTAASPSCAGPTRCSRSGPARWSPTRRSPAGSPRRSRCSSPRFVAIPVVLAFLAVSGWVLFREGLAAATSQAFHFPSLFLVVIVGDGPVGGIPRVRPRGCRAARRGHAGRDGRRLLPVLAGVLHRRHRQLPPRPRRPAAHRPRRPVLQRARRAARVRRRGGSPAGTRCC